MKAPADLTADVTAGLAAPTDDPPAEAANEPARLLEHAYDGIQEYDNPLPGWWRALFWATIVFAAAYWVWHEIADKGASPDDDYRASLADYESKRELRAARDAANVSEELLARNAGDSNVLGQGAKVFAARCASCHADQGQGLIGPNLTDSHQLHGTTRLDLFKTVSKGVPGTAMLAWSEQLPALDVVAVSSFIANLRGQNIAGKEPQGAPVEPFRP